MSLVRMHFCTLTARGYGAVSVPTMYGMNGTMPATVNMIDGSEETREALGTTVCSLAAKKSRKRRWISEVRMDVRCPSWNAGNGTARSEEHTSELQSRGHLVCRLLLDNKRLAGK